MKTITAFAQLRELQKVALLKIQGTVIDSYVDGPDMVQIYYLDGFFVEYIMKEDDSVDIIPFRRGYKLPEHIEAKYNYAKTVYYGMTA